MKAFAFITANYHVYLSYFVNFACIGSEVGFSVTVGLIALFDRFAYFDSMTINFFHYFDSDSNGCLFYFLYRLSHQTIWHQNPCFIFHAK